VNRQKKQSVWIDVRVFLSWLVRTVPGWVTARARSLFLFSLVGVLYPVIRIDCIDCFRTLWIMAFLLLGLAAKV